MRRILPLLATLAALACPALASADVVDDNPAATALAAGRLDVVARASNGQILYRRLTTGTGAWTAWSAIPGFSATSGPAITHYNGQLVVVARGSNNALWYTTGDGVTWSKWTSLGGAYITGPGIDNRTGTTELDVGGIGTNGSFYYRVKPSPATDFKPVASVTTTGTTAPGMISRTTSTIDAFTRDGDSSVIRISFTPGSGWTTQDIGGGATGAISAISRANTKMDIYVKGTGNALYGRTFDGTAFTPTFTKFDTTGGTSAPSAATTGGARVDMVVRDASRLYHRYYDGKGPDHGWYPFTDEGTIAVPPPPPPPVDRGAPNGTGAADGAGITIGFTGSKRTRKTFGYHRAVRLDGVLATVAGPISGATLELDGTPTNPGATERVLKTVTTGPDGHWSARLVAGPSMRLVARYRAFAKDLTTANSRALVARAVTAITFKASRRTAHRGDRVRFRGTLRGHPLPRGGKLLTLQAFDAGRWRTFDQVRTTRTGAYRATYRFHTSPPRARRLRFRAVVPREASYPYERATSRTRRLTLLPG